MPKTAILIDGGYFLKRLPSVRRDVNRSDPDEVARAVNQLVRGHLNQLNETYCVDMRIGLDIATITLNRQADVIVLVSGDSDFVSAAKLARRNGATFILDPLWQNVSPDLIEHIDGLRSGFYRPQNDPSNSDSEVYS